MRLLIRSIARLVGATRRGGGFTLIELLTVMTIIAIMAGLVMAIAGIVNKNAALSRAKVEIKALENACENYKADNGMYPHQPLAISGSVPMISGSNVPSDVLQPAGSSPNGNSTIGAAATAYTKASLELYEALTGDLTQTGTGGGVGTKNYIADMKPDVFGRANMTAAISSSNTVTYLSDPFGDSYGYSTAYATAIATTGSSPNPAPGYNPTFDLWCTGGLTTNPNTPSTSGSVGDPMLQWVTNWR